jgi:hypothetical protein
MKDLAAEFGIDRTVPGASVEPRSPLAEAFSTTSKPPKPPGSTRPAGRRVG